MSIINSEIFSWQISIFAALKNLVQMNAQIEKIKKSIEPFRQEIINHKVYSVINDKEDLKIFMQYHVFAVWDFMSLLKALQNHLTCTNVPWFPKGAPDTRYLINEIVLGEESDIDSFGNRKSHFEIYLDAMHQCGASTEMIESFFVALRESADVKKSLITANVPEEIRDFVDFTFNSIKSEKAHLLSAIFTFGREDLIPGMFYSIVNDMNVSIPESISIFKYYLERHIEVDGEHHSQLAIEMTSNLCEANAAFWVEAEAATVESLKKRIRLWDGIYNLIKSRH